MMRRLLKVLAPLAVLGLHATPAFAWEETGHRLIGVVAAKAFPPELPDFLRRQEVVRKLGELSREPDRSKGAGAPHDQDLDSGHFIDIDDEGKAEGGPSLAALPVNRQQYEAALAAAGTNSWKAGWLPYNIIEGYEQLAKDFAYWRAAKVGERTADTRRQRAWFVEDRKLREMLIVRDLGYWGHFVGDGSQPLHVTLHFNGWGDYPNPMGYTKERIHGPFEGAFVSANVTEAAVTAALTPYQPCVCTAAQATIRYLLVTNAKLEPLYQLCFKGAAPRGTAFVVERVAAGAAELRDMVVDAWRASENYTVGYPKPVTAKSVEDSGKAPYDTIHGPD
jgi:hypothetical protein